MSYSLRLLGSFLGDGGTSIVHEECDCSEARRACMPTFVFSAEGQIGFRQALDHLISCRKLECSRLRKQVIAGMRNKLEVLFDDSIILGCVHVQPSLYSVRSVRLHSDTFAVAARHLARCPKESCARLRRALLLTVRDEVSPNARN